jgi:hypothetical protein
VDRGETFVVFRLLDGIRVLRYTDETGRKLEVALGPRLGVDPSMNTLVKVLSGNFSAI